jgi:hypothetical protein
VKGDPFWQDRVVACVKDLLGEIEDDFDNILRLDRALINHT